MTAHLLLASLTAAQREAVQHVDGPLLILAGPGSGKTRVVTHRIAHLLSQGVHASQILALTFTNKAAEEMRHRLEVLAPGQRVWLSTFHRFCSRLLREHAPLVGISENFTIYDADDSRKVLNRVINTLGYDPRHSPPDRMRSAISNLKNKLVLAEEFVPRSGRPLDRVLADVYPAYQQKLLASSAVDFDDLLLYVARLLRENSEVRSDLDRRYRYILVDEYQDTNLVQYAIVRALSIEYPNLAVTGDPDQSIYGWRGANINNILKFEEDFAAAKVVRLERNYRSTPSILRVADALIKHNVKRKEKALYTENAEGRPVRFARYFTQDEEARNIAANIAMQVHEGSRRASDFAILYRVNALSRVLEDALREQGLPYQIVNGLEFYQRKEVKDILAYLGLINNPRDDLALLRVINTPPRGIGRTTVGHLTAYAERHRLSLLEAAREAPQIEQLKTRALQAVQDFVKMQDRFERLVIAPVEEILGHVLEMSGYQQFLAESDQVEDEARLENIRELLTVAQQFDSTDPVGGLEVFLERTALVNDTDDWENEGDKVTLMTLHAAKGLEFPCVFIIALEDGLLPHERSREDMDQLEEERRLLFVGMTRAKEELAMSQARVRSFRGQQRQTVPSSFLAELPRDEIEGFEAAFHVELPPPDAQRWTPPRQPAVSQAPAEIGTAADLLDKLRDASDTSGTTGGEQTGAALPHVAPDDFHQGMVVVHPTYQLGKVVALSGAGSNRTATVAFATAGQKKFVLSKSKLQPVRRPK